MEQPQEQQQQQQQQQQMKLTDIQITDENVALNVIVSFLTLAQKRGGYTLDESAKIWESTIGFTTGQRLGEKDALPGSLTKPLTKQKEGGKRNKKSKRNKKFNKSKKRKNT